MYNNDMPAKKNILKTIDDLTYKQKKFVEILVSQWGQISQVEAAIKAMALSIREAMSPDSRRDGTPSSKGMM